MRPFAIFFFFLILILAIWGYGSYCAVLKSGEFQIASGESGIKVAGNLKKEGFIKSALVFRAYLKLRPPRRELQSGVYFLEKGRSLGKLADKLSAINTEEISVTVPEGRDLYDIASLLEKNELGTRRDFFRAVGAPAEDYRRDPAASPIIDWAKQYPLLTDKPPYVSMEGYLFPDTNNFFKKTKAEDVVRKMLDNFVKKIGPLGADIKAGGHSLFEIITMASIVEREVRTDKNRAMVADIFWRRLEKGMPLQSDATVNYVTRKSALQPTADDTEIDSPYNTYKYKGLPLGPICNPGLAAITAVLHPEPNDYLYFLTTPEGDIYYSKTYAEHLKNKQKYLK